MTSRDLTPRIAAGLVVLVALWFAFRDQSAVPRRAPAAIQAEAAFRADRYSRACGDPIGAPTIYVMDYEGEKVDLADFPTWSVTIDDEADVPFAVSHGLAHLLTQRRTGRSSMIHEADDFLVLEAFLRGDVVLCPTRRTR